MSVAIDGRYQVLARRASHRFSLQNVYQNDVRRNLKVFPETLMDAYDEIYRRILAQKGSAPQLALNASGGPSIHMSHYDRRPCLMQSQSKLMVPKSILAKTR
jgi:hypothetical protein